MKPMIAMLLILTMSSTAGSGLCAPVSSALMTADQLAAAAGAGFWGGMACGLAAITTAVAAGAIITAVGGGATIGIGVAMAFSVGVHIDAVCLMI
jgi:hypothetical protein